MPVSIRGSGQVPVQVVSATNTTLATTSSTSFVTTGLTASITPSSASNKILAIYHGNGNQTATAGNAIVITLYRNSTNVVSPNGTSPYWLDYMQNNAGIQVSPMSFTYLDSPATTSSVTYTVFFASYNTAGTVRHNTVPGTDTLTLLEISGT